MSEKMWWQKGDQSPATGYVPELMSLPTGSEDYSTHSDPPFMHTLGVTVIASLGS